MAIRKISRYQGALLGLAIGDALGTTLEFQPPGSFTPITDMVGGGPFHLLPGQWTDDTSLALCLAESMIERQGFDPKDQLERYLRWHSQGHLSSTGRCFDIGTTTRYALILFRESRKPYCGPENPSQAGNGSIMRLAPVPLYYAEHPEKAIYFSGESSRTTHQAPETIQACKYFGGLIVGAIQGITKDELLSDYYCPVPGYWDPNPLSPKIADIAAGSYKQKNPPEIRGTGYVVESLEAALWAFYHSNDFMEGALMAVNLGDDADTTGAVYGQIDGAYYGRYNLPEPWFDKFAMRETIELFSAKLYEGRHV